MIEDHEWDAVLPAGIQRAAGTPPSRPECFEDGYVLPEHCEKPLQKLHNHDLDARLVFYEKPHIYTFDGVPTSASVTALAHQFEKPFVAAEAIKMMKWSRSQKWPRREYVHDARLLAEREWTSSLGALLVGGGKTLAVVHPNTFRADATASNVREMLRMTANTDADEDEELYTYTREMEPSEISEMWSRKGRIASHKGTEAHYMAECFFNGLPVRFDDPEMSVLVGFVREHMVPRGIVAYNTEKEIVCKDADVAGSIDLIVWDASSAVYHIVDHKRSDKLMRDLRGYGKMTNAFSHLDDCKGAAYALQTSIYQYILERDYNMPIGDRILLSLHPDQPAVTSVPYMRAEVEFIMQNRMALVCARREVAAEDPARFTCSLTGAPAVDAVRLSDGRVAMEKAAIVQGQTYEPATDTRKAFEAAVQARRVDVPLKKEQCMSWRRRMPEGGIRPFV